MEIKEITRDERPGAVTLLKRNNLPSEDLGDDMILFVLWEGEHMAGTIGLEHNGKEGLLRSLCTDEHSRGRGRGTQMVNFLEQYAREKGLTTLYLLTTTAESFFLKRNYQRINREEVSGFLTGTSEFRSVCPASAVIMKKEL